LLGNDGVSQTKKVPSVQTVGGIYGGGKGNESLKQKQEARFWYMKHFGDKKKTGEHGEKHKFLHVIQTGKNHGKRAHSQKRR